MKKIIVIIGIIAAIFGLSAQTAIVPSVGNGSVNQPYQIATWQNLYWLS